MLRKSHLLCALLLAVPVTACGDSDDDGDRVSELIEDSCRAYHASTGGVRLGEGQPVPVAEKDRLAFIKTAVEKAEEAAEIDDTWLEFSIMMDRLQDQTRREVEAPEGIPPRPDPLMFAALGKVDPNCREFAPDRSA